MLHMHMVVTSIVGGEIPHPQTPPPPPTPFYCFYGNVCYYVSIVSPMCPWPYECPFVICLLFSLCIHKCVYVHIHNFYLIFLSPGNIFIPLISYVASITDT